MSTLSHKRTASGFVAVGEGIHRDSPGLDELLDWSCGSQFIKGFTGRSLNDKCSNGSTVTDAVETKGCIWHFRGLR